MNNKGFMMAEVVVVSAIVLTTLVGLYTSYNKIFSLYNQRVDYYDVATLYDLAYYRDNALGSIGTSLSPVVNDTNEKIYYIDKYDIKKLNVENLTFKDYLEFLSNSLDYETLTGHGVKNILIMEKCSDTDNCKYAYLEVFTSETS